MIKSSNLLAIVLLVFFIGFFLEETIHSSISTESLEDTIEIISELFSVFVALSIFAITWHAYNKSRDNHSLFLGTTFLITGLLILCHLLSYPFMPDFITPNSPHKAAIFFIESRFIMAFLLLASVYVHKDSFPKLNNKYVMMFFTLAILSVSLPSVLFYHDFLFGEFNLDSYSTETVFVLFLISFIILVTGYQYNKRAKETFQININYLAYGSIIILVSNLVYFSYELSGHFLIITGFFYFYLGLYKSSVDLPYERLAISEEKLRRAAEEKYRRLFDNANDAVATIDMDGGITSWNKSAQELFGWTVEEISGKRLVEVLAAPETVAENEKMMCILLSETGTGQETACIRKDGTKIDVSVTISPLLDVNSNVVERSLIIRDITEHKKSEEALRRSEEFSRTVLNSMNDSIMVIDAYDFSIVSVNGFLLKKYELKLEEVIGKKCFEISHHITEPCYLKDELCPLLDSVKTGKYSMVEHVHFGEKGQKIYVEVSTAPIKNDSGKVAQIIHVTRDITERKMAELEYKTILSTAMDGFYVTDSQGRILDINDSYCSIIGYSRDELLNMRIKDIEADETDEIILQRIEKIVKVGRDRFETRHKCKDGKIVDIEASINYMDTGSKKFFVFMRDITKRKQAEAELRASEEKFEKVFRSSPQALTITALNDGRFIEVNDSFTNTLGYSREEAIGHTTLELGIWITPEDRIRFSSALKENGFVHKAELDMMTKKGGIASMLVSAELINVAGKACMLSTFYDITERKRAEKVLRESEEKYKSLITNMAEGFAFHKIITNEKNIPIDYEYIEVNAAFEQMSGLKGDQIIGRKVTEVMPGIESDANDWIGKYGTVALTGKDLKFESYSSVLKKWFFISAYSPNRGYFAVTFIDITDRKQDEEKIRKSLEEKEVLLREIHHRVKNNMQVVSSLLMLQSQNIEDKKYKDIFIESQTRIHSMALIHEKLYQSESIAQINFKEYIDGIVSNIFESYSIKSNIKIDINVENIPITIDYAVPCGLIINELVTNALKYAFPEGRQGKIQISLKSIDNNMIQLSINDDGIGISKDMDIRNTKTLGLHLVTALAEGQLHGRIILNRERGTEFQISFGAK